MMEIEFFHRSDGSQCFCFHKVPFTTISHSGNKQEAKVWKMWTWGISPTRHLLDIPDAVIYGDVCRKRWPLLFPFCLFTLKDFQHQLSSFLSRWSWRWMFSTLFQCTENDSRLNGKQSLVSKRWQWKFFNWKEMDCFWKAWRNIAYGNTRLHGTPETHNKP